VQSTISYSCGFEQGFPFVMIRAWIDRTTVGLSEYPITFLSEFRRLFALFVLPFLMLTQRS
jgi:hypothetical protein